MKTHHREERDLSVVRKKFEEDGKSRKLLQQRWDILQNTCQTLVTDDESQTEKYRFCFGDRVYRQRGIVPSKDGRAV